MCVCRERERALSRKVFSNTILAAFNFAARCKVSRGGHNIVTSAQLCSQFPDLADEECWCSNVANELESGCHKVTMGRVTRHGAWTGLPSRRYLTPTLGVATLMDTCNEPRQAEC